ncbi:hypothetical protein A5790_05325 [Mycobacterium sp. 852002-51152_SCH6134967]|uniref:serine/threonine-protein kinase n=1 Tax=Mycobacterium sp. 852002-51152_SCH6134967 TaxID=1834096 RepID=UPI0007FC3BB4|nr:serine/threonine-protein kinase [Mycobacterium sp. 852002-51152_SCH6134967]OBF96451.1 hypothetical protein A5790_05325 [Mycobacterium sp. 852002-51152_SCH6134967]
MPMMIGKTFADYRVLRLLGSGGMGEVYLVQHPRLPRQEALKVLRPDISSDPSFRERFIREADLAAGLRHPHIVGIHDRGEHDGQLWIAMDYIDGTDAAHLLDQKYPAGMPVDLVLTIVTAVASALDYAHRKGLLHRDVKPANIIVADLDTDDPNAFLADFGIARPVDEISGITTTNMTVGTVAYAAPEQLMGKDLDGRADQYALAATVYTLVTGTVLFPDSNPIVVISHHLSEPAPAASTVDSNLGPFDPIFARALAKKPEDRFPTCQEFAREFARATAASPAVSPTAPTQQAPVSAEPDAQVHRRIFSPALLALATAIMLALLGGGVAIWRPWANQQDQTANPNTTSKVSSTASTAPTEPSISAAPPPSPTTGSPPPPTPVTTNSTTTSSTSIEAQQDDWREHNTWVCNTGTGEVCGNWKPEAVTFACKAVASGADYTEELQNMLMSRYGMGETDAFFLGKEAWYSVSSGGYISTGSMADGPHPLCNGIIP